jgi:hypothetical protein
MLSQNSATGLYSEPAELDQNLYTLLLEINLNINPSLMYIQL